MPAQALDPQQLVAVVAAVIGGLVAFAALLMAGTGIVRWLRLPQELPEGPRFEPPPPPLRASPDRVAARATAARQAELQALYARGLAIATAAQQCQELCAAAEAVTGVAPADREAALAALRGAATTASAASDAAGQVLAGVDQALRAQPPAQPDDLAALAAALDDQMRLADAALAAARAAVQALPDLSGRRRLWLMVAALVVLLVWVMAMSLITRR